MCEYLYTPITSTGLEVKDMFKRDIDEQPTGCLSLLSRTLPNDLEPELVSLIGKPTSPGKQIRVQNDNASQACQTLPIYPQLMIAVSDTTALKLGRKPSYTQCHKARLKCNNGGVKTPEDRYRVLSREVWGLDKEELISHSYVMDCHMCQGKGAICMQEDQDDVPNPHFVQSPDDEADSTFGHDNMPQDTILSFLVVASQMIGFFTQSIKGFTDISMQTVIENFDFIAFDDHLLACGKEFSIIARENEAKIHSSSFVFPENILDKGRLRLFKDRSIKKIIQHSQFSQEGNCLSQQRVHDCFHGHVTTEDLIRMKNIAYKGIDLFIHKDFKKQQFPSALRPIAKRLGNCFKHHAYQLVSSGKALAFRYSDLIESGCLIDVGFQMSAHWTTKPPK